MFRVWCWCLICLDSDFSWQPWWPRGGWEQTGQDGVCSVHPPASTRLSEWHLSSTWDYGLWWWLGTHYKLTFMGDFMLRMVCETSSSHLPQVIAGWLPPSLPHQSSQWADADWGSSSAKTVAVCQRVHWELSVMESMTVEMDQMRCTVVSFTA